MASEGGVLKFGRRRYWTKGVHKVVTVLRAQTRTEYARRMHVVLTIYIEPVNTDKVSDGHIRDGEAWWV